MNTWKSLHPWSIYSNNPELEAWMQVRRAAIVDALIPDPYDWKGRKVTKATEIVSNAYIHTEGIRAFARILSAKESARDAQIDRKLARRTDSLGDLFTRAPKRERKVA